MKKWKNENHASLLEIFVHFNIYCNREHFPRTSPFASWHGDFSISIQKQNHISFCSEINRIARSIPWEKDFYFLWFTFTHKCGNIRLVGWRKRTDRMTRFILLLRREWIMQRWTWTRRKWERKEKWDSDGQGWARYEVQNGLFILYLGYLISEVSCIFKANE